MECYSDALFTGEWIEMEQPAANQSDSSKAPFQQGSSCDQLGLKTRGRL
jgi:hypothetical protein